MSGDLFDNVLCTLMVPVAEEESERFVCKGQEGALVQTETIGSFGWKQTRVNVEEAERARGSNWRGSV